MINFVLLSLTEARLQHAIFERFGALDYHHAAIKTCDLILLATEKRDLMPATSAEWAPLPPPLPESIVPWTQEKAKWVFLMEFRRLSAMLGTIESHVESS